MGGGLKHPFKIGITGGIGVGKTTVSKIFQNIGVPIFNADKHKLLKINLRKAIANNVQSDLF